MRPKMKTTPEELEAMLKEDEAANAEAAAIIEEPPPTVPRPELVAAWVKVMNYYPER